MLNQMRVKLALYFMCLVLVLHLAGATAFYVLFSASLVRSNEALLADLVSEIRPSIKVEDGRPTLQDWAKRADEANSIVTASIQVFDTNKKLLEKYGSDGIERLARGRLEERDHQGKRTVRSLNEKINSGGKLCGYLQVQVSTKQNDQASELAIYATIVAMPFLGALVAIAGYLFSGLALKPAEQAMQLTRRFVADAGHELNTPIAIIEASLEALSEILRENNVKEDLTEIIAKASARMSELASDLIFLARVENPISHYVMTPVSVKKLLEDVCEDFTNLAKTRNIHFKLGSVSEQEIMGNLEFLRRMVTNLASNALRYTDEGGTIIIWSEVEGRNLAIKVSDTGIGIPQESINHVFDRFYRVDKARARAAGGAGLGLSIVKAVVESHKGNISVTSEVGRGSTFKVTIPLA
ncbi:MAG TPA: HAMP domain-containing histidine kinase [Candidatus Melainabacteria bacterium]|nr:HAMP domain-containing histidine kinase [Candidatus Melainabacteria bacterium]HIN66017.1 HAMP domain-containing histidine kinase [Candidatus Obscuribacterales bacterium]